MQMDGESFQPNANLSHRRVDREGGRIITETPEEVLAARGYKFLGTLRDDGSLPQTGSLVGLDQKEDEFGMTVRGVAKRQAPTTLREKVGQFRRTGYDIRLVRIPDAPVFRAYRRFDLDRFITRMPERKMGIEEYSLQTKRFRYHVWGDGLADYSDEDRKRFQAEIDEIERYVVQCANQNFQVVFIEKRHDNDCVLEPFTRPQRREAFLPPLEVKRPLNGITNETPEILMQRGFEFLESVPDDESLSREPILALDGAYMAAGETLESSGIVPEPMTPKQFPSVRERIIIAVGQGNEIRVVRGEYNEHSGILKPNSHRLSLFRRFDLIRFVEPQEAMPHDLLGEKFSFIGSFPIVQWGDKSITEKTKGLSQAARSQLKKIENNIRDKEADGYRVRCIIGRMYPDTGNYEPANTFISLFAKRK